MKLKNNNYEKTIQIENIPEELKAQNQWVTWRAENRKNGKIAKIPVDPMTGNNANVSDKSTWSDFDIALHRYENDSGISGIGFVFSKGDPYIGIDIDNAIDAKGVVSMDAEALLNRFNSYSEVSPSGKGFHIIVKSDAELAGTRQGNVELYSHQRFFTVTGNLVSGHPKQMNELDEVLSLHEELSGKSVNPGKRESAPSEFAEALEDKYGQKFKSLWGGDTSSYNSHSEADLALCRMLAGATDKNVFEIDRLFCQSGLYRDKWKRDDYKNQTIQNAVKSLKSSGKATRTYYALTDLGNGERFAAQNRDKARWCQQWKSWLVWDGKRWNNEGNLLVRQLAKDTVRSIYNEASQAGDDDRVKISRHANSSEAIHRVDAMLTAGKAEKGMAIRAEELDKPSWLLNCSNGIIDLKTGELVSHNPEYLLTKLVKVDYDPTALCPYWLTFLNEIMGGDQEMISYLQRAVGYSLTGDTSEQCIFILHGSGANGKSTFLSPINTILHDYAKQSPVETFLAMRKKGANNDVARLKGARFVTASEPDADQRFAESLLKLITGGDTVSARFLNQEYFDFKPILKLFLATNHKPKVNSDDKAMWRRLRLIPFEVTIPEHRQDKRLLEKLHNELEGILAWAVQGCIEWQQVGLGVPERVREATKEYAKEMDTFGRFLDERCEQAACQKTSTKILYQAYVSWCQEEGEHPLTKVMFGKKLGDLGFEPARNRTGRGWKGLGLLQDDETPPVPPNFLAGQQQSIQPAIH